MKRRCESILHEREIEQGILSVFFFFLFINVINMKEVTSSFYNGILHVMVLKGLAFEKNLVEIHYGERGSFVLFRL